jgi:hypothetical protein
VAVHPLVFVPTYLWAVSKPLAPNGVQWEALVPLLAALTGAAAVFVVIANGMFDGPRRFRLLSFLVFACGARLGLDAANAMCRIDVPLSTGPFNFVFSKLDMRAEIILVPSTLDVIALYCIAVLCGMADRNERLWRHWLVTLHPLVFVLIYAWMLSKTDFPDAASYFPVRDEFQRLLIACYLLQLMAAPIFRGNRAVYLTLSVATVLCTAELRDYGRWHARSYLPEPPPPIHEPGMPE